MAKGICRQRRQGACNSGVLCRVGGKGLPDLTQVSNMWEDNLIRLRQRETVHIC